MRLLAFFLALLVASPSWADSDAPTLEPDVIEVRMAETPDGFKLGEGWWLSRKQMKAVGTEIVRLRNSERACTAKECTEYEVNVPVGFWIGLGLGFVGGIAGTAYAFQLVRK